MTTPRMVRIDPLSGCSLLLELLANGQQLGSATGFSVLSEGKTFLVTNWHVLAGRNPDTGQPCHPSAAIPDQVRVFHHAANALGTWLPRTYALQNPGGQPLWVEHPTGSTTDVVALPLSSLDPGISVYPFDLGLADFDMVVKVAMPVAVIGFPYGLSAGGRWPIWKTGHIATDPDVDYDRRPAFLIDATTRGGMSGSPVVCRMYGQYESSEALANFIGGAATRFLGIYSGRIHPDAEVGRVWRPEVVTTVLQRACSHGT